MNDLIILHTCPLTGIMMNCTKNNHTTPNWHLNKHFNDTNSSEDVNVIVT